MALQGFKSLNRIQSIVFPTAYGTNENMLICAPTGAGKTNVAMMSILHCIEAVSGSFDSRGVTSLLGAQKFYDRFCFGILRQHVEMGVIMKDQFKIVYVAPMKALAAEMVESFSKRFVSSFSAWLTFHVVTTIAIPPHH